LNRGYYRSRRKVNRRRVNLTVREQCDGALMFNLARVRVEQFMQVWRGGQRVQKQNETHQQTA
jgi:hypothetical protein